MTVKAAASARRLGGLLLAALSFGAAHCRTTESAATIKGEGDTLANSGPDCTSEQNAVNAAQRAVNESASADLALTSTSAPAPASASASKKPLRSYKRPATKSTRRPHEASLGLAEGEGEGGEGKAVGRGEAKPEGETKPNAGAKPGPEENPGGEAAQKLAEAQEALQKCKAGNSGEPAAAAAGDDGSGADANADAVAPTVVPADLVPCWCDLSTTGECGIWVGETLLVPFFYSIDPPYTCGDSGAYDLCSTPELQGTAAAYCHF